MKYVFHCSCGLIFSRSMPVGNYKSLKCPSCSNPAPRKLDEAFAFSFKEEGAGNTGVHKEDYPTADHAVGRDADRKWALLHERQKLKQQARAMGQTQALMRTTTDRYIDYTPMSDAGIKARRRLVDKAVPILKNDVKQ